MSDFYYLVSSLPLLNLEAVPLIDSKGFLDSCIDFISKDEMEKLNLLSLIPEKIEGYDSTICEWFLWEITLRNTILLSRKNIDFKNPEKYLRDEDDFFLEIQKGVQDAFSKRPVEREDALDMIRWNKIRDLELGHDFDFTKLCLYKLKLLLCEKRKDREEQKGSENYDEIVDNIYGINPLSPPQIEENIK